MREVSLRFRFAIDSARLGEILRQCIHLKIDQLTAMKWMRAIWNEIEDQIIHDCWMKTGIIEEVSANAEYANNVVEADRSELASILDLDLPPQHTARVDDLFNGGREKY